MLQEHNTGEYQYFFFLFRTQNTFERMAIIIRNEFYNAYGAVSSFRSYNIKVVRFFNISDIVDFVDRVVLFREALNISKDGFRSFIHKS